MSSMELMKWGKTHKPVALKVFTEKTGFQVIELFKCEDNIRT